MVNLRQTLLSALNEVVDEHVCGDGDEGVPHGVRDDQNLKLGLLNIKRLDLFSKYQFETFLGVVHSLQKIRKIIFLQNAKIKVICVIE